MTSEVGQEMVIVEEKIQATKDLMGANWGRDL